MCNRIYSGYLREYILSMSSVKDPLKGRKIALFKRLFDMLSLHDVLQLRMSMIQGLFTRNGHRLIFNSDRYLMLALCLMESDQNSG